MELELPGDEINPATVHRGLVSRVGPLDDWRIEVEPSGVRGTFDVRVEEPGGGIAERQVVLEAGGDEARSRELASSLTVLIEELREKEAEAPATGESAAGANENPVPVGEQKDPRGYVAVWPRTSLGSPAAPDLGIGVAAGGHVGPARSPRLVQPRGQISWARSLGTGTLAVDQLRIGVGAGLGHDIRSTWWLGGLVVPHATWLRAEDRGVQTRWLFSAEVGGLVQFTYRRLLVEARAGAELALPPTRIRGASSDQRLGYVRFFGGLGIGIRI